MRSSRIFNKVSVGCPYYGWIGPIISAAYLVPKGASAIPARPQSSARTYPARASLSLARARLCNRDTCIWDMPNCWPIFVWERPT